MANRSQRKQQGGSKDGRFRVMHRFWLDLTNPIEEALDEWVFELKQTRRFASTMRDGLRLMMALRKSEDSIEQGEQPGRQHISLIEKLFPRTFKWIVDNHHSAELERLGKELAALQAKVETGHTVGGEPKKRLPILLSDDMDTVVIKKKVDVKSNFMKMVKGMKDA